MHIVIYPSRKKAITLSLAAGVFIALGIVFAVFQEEMGLPTWIIVLISYIGVPFFALGLAFLMYRAMVPKPLLVIDETGILDHASMIGVGLIRWEEIERMVPYEVMGVQLLGIVPTNPEHIIARVNPLKQMLLRANMKPGYPLISIPESILPMKIDVLIRQLKHYPPAKEKFAEKG
jgi:hypothetical protein